jgi:hypothetical protein
VLDCLGRESVEFAEVLTGGVSSTMMIKKTAKIDEKPFSLKRRTSALSDTYKKQNSVKIK